MIAGNRGRTLGRSLAALAAAGTLGGAAVLAQAPKAKAPAGQPKPAPAPRPGAAPEQPTLKLTAVPVNPNDAVATVNGESITRQQLADECVIRKGEEILETLIARKLIDQAIKTQKIEVTPAEVDAEIERVAQQMAGLSREAWLRTLHKERNISPVQYARDIIYPALALRKLAEPSVQVTPTDVKEAYEAQFGEKLKARVIMTARVDHAKQIWEELRKDPSKFEHIAQNDGRSIDQATRSMGGLLMEPICRHAYPRTVSDAAFAQLVDGDKEGKFAPKNGDFTGPIQVGENSWVIVRREKVLPAQKYDPNDPATAKQIKEAIFEVKLKERMGEIYEDMMRRAAIDNKLTGQVSVDNNEVGEIRQANGEVPLMSSPAKDPRLQKTKADEVGRATVAPPPGVSKDDLERARALKK